jgi:predicted ATPase
MSSKDYRRFEAAGVRGLRETMAQTKDDFRVGKVDDESIQIKSFRINGLFGYLDHKIDFPILNPGENRPEMIILEGQNGTGKTTIMEMIAGIVNGLDFDPFRGIPFKNAELTLTNGLSISVESTGERDFPLYATFQDYSTRLHKAQGSEEYSPEDFQNIDRFRGAALPYLNVIDFELMTIERTLLLIDHHADDQPLYIEDGVLHRRKMGDEGQRHLASRVSRFLREAQINQRKFFETSHLNLLPRIINQLSSPRDQLDKERLLNRLMALQVKSDRIRNAALFSDDSEIVSLIEFIQNSNEMSDDALQVSDSYIKLSEGQLDRLIPLAERIEAFEEIMADFFVGKSVKVSSRFGLDIKTATGKLSETDLSSGEYHFLYMMVSALLCQRRGTVLAIDEPELSLHVSWQRKLVSALTRCASGAAPLFFFSTHSTTISANHAFAVQSLSPID